MELSQEFWAQIIVQLIALAFVAGGIIQQIRNISNHIEKLEKKQEKHNNLIARMAVAENDIQEVKEDIKEMRGD